MKAISQYHLKKVRGAKAFTMVEIALCLAIIGFAMVAIIGVLPTGLQVQQSNREDTIVNEDGAFWMQAIKGGAQGLYDLTNFVDEIQITRYLRSGVGGIATSSFPNFNMTSSKIIGFLSTPKYRSDLDTYYTNVYAKVRAIGGSAAEKNLVSHDMAFSYMLQVEIMPYSAYPANFFGTNLSSSTSGSASAVERTNYFNRGISLATNLFDVRLTMRWPVFGSANRWRVGNNKQTFRSLVNARIGVQRDNQTNFFFLNPTSVGPFIY